MLLFIAEKKIPAGTQGYGDTYVIQLDRPLRCPIDAPMFSVDYAVKVSGDVGLLWDLKPISEQLRQLVLSEISMLIASWEHDNLRALLDFTV